MRLVPASRRGRVAIGAAILAMAAGVAGVFALRGPSTPSVATAEVTRGDYADVLEIRGDIRPVRSTYVMAPSNAGELLILKIAKNGTAVKAGDVVAEFDAITIRRTIQEKQSELRGAIAERDQAKAQASITIEEKAAAVRRARFDLQRAELGVTEDPTIFSNIQIARAKLGVADAAQRLREAEAAETSTREGIGADFAARERRIEKTQAELDRAQNSVEGSVRHRAGGWDGQRPAELPVVDADGHAAGVPHGRPRVSRRADSRAAGPDVGLPRRPH